MPPIIKDASPMSFSYYLICLNYLRWDSSYNHPIWILSIHLMWYELIRIEVFCQFYSVSTFHNTICFDINMTPAIIAVTAARVMLQSFNVLPIIHLESDVNSSALWSTASFIFAFANASAPGQFSCFFSNLYILLF